MQIIQNTIKKQNDNEINNEKTFCRYTLNKIFNGYIINTFIETYRSNLPDYKSLYNPNAVYYYPKRLNDFTYNDLKAMYRLNNNLLKYFYQSKQGLNNLNNDIDFVLVKMFKAELKKIIKEKINQ